jgi:hypothetical protein
MRLRLPDFFIHSGDTIYADGPVPAQLATEGGRIWRNITTEAKSKVAKKHFDMALDRYLQPEKIELCPQLCPQLRRVFERSRMAISDADLDGRGWYSVPSRILDEQPESGKFVIVR